MSDFYDFLGSLAVAVVVFPASRCLEHLFDGSEDLYVSSDEAVCDSFSAVDSCAAHHDAVLDLGVLYGGGV